MSGRPSPVVGWRVWRLRDGRLHSWKLDYEWEPGPHRARCLVAALSPLKPTCAQAPGEGCTCGFWALWDPMRALRKARREHVMVPAGFTSVVGVMLGWGGVAIHGDEGFRAEHATVACLISNAVWDEDADRVVEGRIRWWRRIAHRFEVPDRSRPELLRAAGQWYGVPVVSLGDAVRLGVLQELGVNRDQVAGLRRRLFADAA